MRLLPPITQIELDLLFKGCKTSNCPIKGSVHGASAGLREQSARRSGFAAEPIYKMFGGVFSLAEVKVQEGEPLENALRRFKRKVQTEDIIKEVKRHSFYLKPGEKKRVKAALARKRNRKKARKEQD